MRFPKNFLVEAILNSMEVYIQSEAQDAIVHENSIRFTNARLKGQLEKTNAELCQARKEVELLQTELSHWRTAMAFSVAGSALIYLLVMYSNSL